MDDLTKKAVSEAINSRTLDIGTIVEKALSNRRIADRRKDKTKRIEYAYKKLLDKRRVIK